MQMRRRMNELLQAAKDNDELFAKTRTLTLELLNVHNWQELNEVLATYMLADFQADFVCCHLVNLPVHLDHLASHDERTALRPLRALERAGLHRAPGRGAGRPVPDSRHHENDGSAVLAPIFWEGR